MSEVIAATVGSLAGAGVEALHGGRRDRARDSRERRRAGADDILRALRPLHRRMRKVQFLRNVKKWAKTIDRALRTIEVHRDLLPDGWHLHRNVRDAVGTATGLGLHDLPAWTLASSPLSIDCGSSVAPTTWTMRCTSSSAGSLRTRSQRQTGCSSWTLIHGFEKSNDGPPSAPNPELRCRWRWHLQ